MGLNTTLRVGNTALSVVDPMRNVVYKMRALVNFKSV